MESWENYVSFRMNCLLSVKVIHNIFFQTSFSHAETIRLYIYIWRVPWQIERVQDSMFPIYLKF